MSMAWMVAHGDVPLGGSQAAPAWACTGCFACREWCDHQNPVTGVLLDARDALTRRGVAPEAAAMVLRRFSRHDEKTRTAARHLALGQAAGPTAPDALLIGCGYMRAARAEARQAIDVATTLTGGRVALTRGCCGLPLRLAGSRDAFATHARAFARSLEGHARVIVVDAGCAMALERLYPEAGIPLAPGIELLVELAARESSALSHVPSPPEPVRWHDPCQLGRGLGVYDPPRAVLARVLGRPPEEFDQSREQAVCSGAGGLLPSTMPAAARTIADARLAAHARAGGGRLVTACAASLLALRRRSRGTGVLVEDLLSWIARGLGRADSPVRLHPPGGAPMARRRGGP
jgi:Fe-S oxidoreductase